MFIRVKVLWFGFLLMFAHSVSANTTSYPSFSPHTQVMDGQYAVVFFHFSECIQCHHFSPTMMQFQKAIGLPVYDFSFDGKPIPGFQVPVPVTPDITNAFFGNIKNAVTPATFLININTGKYVRMSEGNVTYQSLLSTYKKIRNDAPTMESMQ
ncbi:conjugal transfer protein TraF [Enterovibrio norvegicus]|uniref:Conjugal transfer protein TraF n=1 Tax=Enterovibrio norvegicus TaxID=188144 RepID=A0ABV4L5D1_9GAMM